jgi:hypothetical protein|tara:strand:- start:123 stop:290 length:168 start_codon:yes stop_codon:yes gene_type:complete
MESQFKFRAEMTTATFLINSQLTTLEMAILADQPSLNVGYFFLGCLSASLQQRFN